MIKRTFRILKCYPRLIGVYSIFIIINAVISSIMTKYENFNIDTSVYNIETAASRMLGLWIVILIISILFMSGFGNMISRAVKTDRCTFRDFFSGLNNFLGRMLAACFLLILMVFLFLMIVSIAAFPIVMAESLGALKNAKIILEIFIIAAGVLAIFIYPCIMLWYPAIFLDDMDVIEGLKKSAVLSKKCYWLLVITTFISALPSLIYNLISLVVENSSVGQIVSMIISAFLSFFISVFTFVIYEEKGKSIHKS